MSKSKERSSRRYGPHIPVDFDLKTSLREWCTCPHCYLVWEHPETTNDRGDWDWVKARYMGRIPCPQCGAISEAVLWENKRGMAKVFGNQSRHLVSVPNEDQNIYDPLEQPLTQHHQKERLFREEHDS